MGDMPWLSVPYEGKTRGTIAQLLGVSALPTLLVFDEDQQLITANGRQEIIKDQKGENFPWYPKVRAGCLSVFWFVFVGVFTSPGWWLRWLFDSIPVEICRIVKEFFWS